MDAMEDKIGAILNNPAMMQQIMSMAQSLSGQAEPPKQESPPPEPPGESMLDPQTLQKLMSFAGQTGIDQNQKNLLHALRPYLSQHHIAKLEKAMRAAKLANFASAFLGNGGLSMLTGR